MLLTQYKKARRGLDDMIKGLEETEEDKEDKRLLNNMKNEVEYIINWLKIGYDPDNPQGINIKHAYDITKLENMDVLPDLNKEIRKEFKVSEKDRKTMTRLLLSLSDRERDCFILRIAHEMTLQEIATDLDISISSVQTYLERVDKKTSKALS